MKKNSISVIIPVYNEEQLLEEKASKLSKDLKKLKLDYEMILVENGSKDNSHKIALDLSMKDKNIKVVRLMKPSYGLALKIGFSKATKTLIANFSVDWIDLKFVKQAILHLDKNSIIIASKTLGEDRRPFIRKIGSLTYHNLIRIMFNIPVSDTHGIKVMKRKDVISLVKKCIYGDNIFDTELIIRSFQGGLKIKELPVNLFELRSPRSSIFKRGFKELVNSIYLSIKINQERLINA